MFPDLEEPSQQKTLYKIILSHGIEKSGWLFNDPFDQPKMEIYVSILLYLHVYDLYYLSGDDPSPMLPSNSEASEVPSSQTISEVAWTYESIFSGQGRDPVRVG